MNNDIPQPVNVGPDPPLTPPKRGIADPDSPPLEGLGVGPAADPRI